ncbi:MAG: PD40 domain-containing protein, partial [Candidatus Lambdaproteobacteria bacterium]|nr:PD40 domain-containing protein [Candidatus Lambdaproteobacteria bacterium]
MAALILAGVLGVSLGAGAWAQSAPQGEEPPQSWEDRAGAALGDDIIIEGLGFSKLILELAVDPALTRNAGFRGQRELLEKNLCWSGLFKLAGAAEDYCAITGEPSRVDMRLEFAPVDGRLRLRLRDTGPEGLALFEEGLPLGARTPERDVMDLVNRLTERITGKPGLLGTTIAFVLRQPGRAKVIVATTTHGERLKLFSNNSDISLLPRWSPDGNILVYTVLGQEGSRVFLQYMLPGQGARNTFLTGSEGVNSGGTFSPDGRLLALTMSVNRNADLFRFDLNTMRAEPLTSRTGIETQADWSPDGRKIVFVSDRTG